MLVQYEARPQKRKAKGPDVGGGRRVRHNQLLQARRALLLPRWAWTKERGMRFNSHGFQKMFALIAAKRGIGRGSVLNSSLIKIPAVKLISTNGLRVVNRSRRLRQWS
ncbi:UNVERIFIED_CONTAM: hypothetical protein Slati_4217100 [Sesamum latifolium]|uniref:Uncharacterized protein n=1 Tax=Sesamum latifolium TaxID=2727402 RepID=A0AAW2TC49_9LAMI